MIALEVANVSNMCIIKQQCDDVKTSNILKCLIELIKRPFLSSIKIKDGKCDVPMS